MPASPMPRPDPTDVLFALSDTGGGHRAVSSALAAELAHQTHGAVSSALVDVLASLRLPMVRSAPGIYDRLSASFGRLYDVGYALTNHPVSVRLIAHTVHALAGDSVAELLQAAAPRLVVVTHPVLIAHLVAWARRAHGFHFRLVSVVTDPVSLHAGWACREADACIVFSEAARDRLARLGMPREKIAIGGFPVHPAFDREAPTRAAARATLGLAPDAFTVLVTGGLAGVGFRASLVEALDARGDVTQLVVTGHNEALRARLARTTDPARTRLLGPVSTMPALMAAADVVISKAGPSTLMEAQALGRPVVITRAVGPQEVGNVALAESQGFARFRQSDAEIVAAVEAVRTGAWVASRWRQPALTRADTAAMLLRQLPAMAEGAAASMSPAGGVPAVPAGPRLVA